MYIFNNEYDAKNCLWGDFPPELGYDYICIPAGEKWVVCDRENLAAVEQYLNI
jgi:hypothetical protein